MHAHLKDNIIMAGAMRDEFAGGTFVTAAMSDDMAAGVGPRCTAPPDVWVHGLVGMEERPATWAADGIVLNLECSTNTPAKASCTSPPTVELNLGGTLRMSDCNLRDLEVHHE